MKDFRLDVTAVQLGFDLTINGFLVACGTTTRPKAFSGRVDGYLVPGANRLVANAHPLPLDPDLEDAPSLQLRLMAPDAREPTDAMDLVVIAAHDSQAVRFAKEGKTEVLRHTFEVDETRARPRFLDARPLEGDSGARELSRTLIAALEARSEARVRELYGLRFDELGAASGLGRAEFEEGFMDPIAHAMKAASFAVETPPGGRLEIEQGFGYRVLHVRGPGGTAPVTLRGGGVELSLGWSIAEIDGRPTIVR